MKGVIVLSMTLVLGMQVALLMAEESDTVRVTHRFDYRRWVNKDYQGFVHGYLTGAWKMLPSDAGNTAVDAHYEQAFESRKDNALTEKPISGEKEVRFQINEKGWMSDFQGDGVPLYRNFPAPLPSEAGPGSSWTSNGDLAEDFLGSGHTTLVPILIGYQWVGPGIFEGVPVIQVKTQYALRYRSGDDPHGDPSLVKIEGSRIGMVSYDQATHRVLFIRETAQELITASDKTLRNDGIVLTFYEGVPALGTATVVQSLNRVLDAKALSEGPPMKTDLQVEPDPRGVKITLNNLQFVADQTELLPGEDNRFATIAQLLQTVPGRNILVVGHTAAIGTQDSQDQLSVARAVSIVQKLKASGIPPQRLLYEGRGGRDSVASNDTEEGRAKNRRVEIIILDQ